MNRLRRAYVDLEFRVNLDPRFTRFPAVLDEGYEPGRPDVPTEDR